MLVNARLLMTRRLEGSKEPNFGRPIRRTSGDRLQVEIVSAGGIRRTYADPSQLESALIDVCVNARDAMPVGGHSHFKSMRIMWRPSRRNKVSSNSVAQMRALGVN